MTDEQPDLPDLLELPTDGDERLPVAASILRCLQMLADEAAALRLPLTLEGLRRAMAACAVEAAEVADGTSDVSTPARPPGATLH